MKRNEISTMIFDRTDPHDEYCRQYVDGAWVITTVLDDLKAGHRFHRSDMAMVNFFGVDSDAYDDEDRIPIQICVYFKRDRILWNGVRYFFTKEEQARLEALRQKLLEVVKEYPEMSTYFYGG